MAFRFGVVASAEESGEAERIAMAVYKRRHRDQGSAAPGADGIPPDMCRRCGLRCGQAGPHEDYRECIGALRDLVARLQFARRGANENAMLRA